MSDNERGIYEEPQVEDLGQIHEVTRHHGKIAQAGDFPQGSREHVGGFGS